MGFSDNLQVYRFSVDSGSSPFIFIDFRLSTIYLSTVSPSPLTAGTHR